MPRPPDSEVLEPPAHATRVSGLPAPPAGEDPVAARAALERELAEHRRRLELVRKASHTVIYVLELATLKVEWVNLTPGGALGYTEGELENIAEPFFRRHLHPDELARLPELEARWRAAPDGEVIEVEHRLRHKSGSFRTFLARDMVHTRGPDGVPTHLIGTLVDVTTRRELQRLAARGAKLEAVSRMTGQVALDFNNLLTVVLGRVALARDALAQGGDPGPHLDELLRVAEQAATISRRLMGFAREQTSTPERLDAAAFLRDHEALLTRLVAATHPIGTPPRLTIETAETWPILIDPTQLTQILVALVARADERGGQVVIRTGRTAAPRTTWLVVEDEGPLESALHGTADTDKGRGADLGTVAGLVRQHHGELTLEADLSGGRVRLSFPAATQDARPLEAAEHSAPEARPLPPRPDTGALVIVAEDEPMVAELTRRILTHAGHRVKLCKDGLEALEAIRAHEDEVALVISDIVMPRLSGLELVSQLVRELPDLPVLLASGYPEDERRLNDPTLADVAFLPKPFRAADLLAAVGQLLARHAARTQARSHLEA